MQQRYYDPGIGMFLSVDPVTAHSDPVGQFDRYRYANNNPYKFIDPDGRARACANGACTITADTYDSSRSNGQPTVASPAVRAKVESTKWKAKSEGSVEKTYFVVGDGKGGLKTHTPSNAEVKTGGSRSANTASVTIPKDAAALVHGHIENGRESANGMVDVPSENGGYGDSVSLSLNSPIPTATVFDGNVGWHEIASRSQTPKSCEGIQNCIDTKLWSFGGPSLRTT